MKTEIRPENEMKDSGVEWIGSIPSSWMIFPANKVFCEVKEKNRDLKYVNAFSFKYGEIVDKMQVGDVDDNLQETLSSYTVVKKNNIMINGLNLNYDFVSQRVAIVNETGVITSAYLAVQPDESKLNPKYVLYLLKSYDFQQVFHGLGSGIRKTLKYKDFKAVMIVAPQLFEQQAIADYLDEVCSKIDEIIAEARASIEEYKELKQAVIVEAVTKGLYKNVEVKETGEKWLNKIPKHWRMEKGKKLLFETNYRSVDGQEELLTVSQYTGITPRSKKNVTMFQAESLVDYKICEVGDIAANTMWMWAGAVGVSRYRGIISPSYNTYRQKRNDYNSDYLDYLLRIAPLVDEYASLSTGIRASRLRLYPTKFLSINYPVPPLVEQMAIVDWLNEQLPKYDSLITEKEALIADLEAYKKSLIYELVTGKRRVV